MKRIRILSVLMVSLVLLLLVVLWWPFTAPFAAHPQPAQNYADAMAQFADMQALDTDELFPECHSTLLTHGARTARAIVFLHGVPNCPAQFAALGQQFYALGYNVIIPRLPHHGFADRTTTEIAKLTAEELVASADASVNIAGGLGEQVTVVGFSTGGAMAAWVAQQRSDVDQTVLLSPFLSPKEYPAWMVGPLTRVLLVMPNQFWWWDENLQEQIPGPRYGNPHYSTHAMAEVMRLSFAVRRQAQLYPPQTGSVLVITNASAHESVDNAVTAQLVGAWQGWDVADVLTYELAHSMDLEHNYVDPDAPNQPVNVVEVVHPLLIEQIERPAQ